MGILKEWDEAAGNSLDEAASLNECSLRNLVLLVIAWEEVISSLTEVWETYKLVCESVCIRLLVWSSVMECYYRESCCKYVAFAGEKLT